LGPPKACGKKGREDDGLHIFAKRPDKTPETRPFHPAIPTAPAAQTLRRTEVPKAGVGKTVARRKKMRKKGVVGLFSVLQKKIAASKDTHKAESGGVLW